MSYQKHIAQDVADDQIDPRHVEAFMRLQYGTLNHLDPATFKAEARIGAQCVRECGPQEAEDLARSYGL